MPDALDLLKSRRSVKIPDLVAPAPDAADLDTILTVAARVPDHGKLVPFRFVVIAGESRARIGAGLASIQASDGADADRLAIERARFTRTPMQIGVISTAGPHPKIPEWEQILTAGVVCAHVCLAAQALGYGTNWITEWYAFDPRARQLFGLSEGERIAGFIHVGTPLQRADDRPRPDIAALTTRL